MTRRLAAPTLMLVLSPTPVMALELLEGWAPLAPPGAAVAGYVTLRNPAAESVTVVGAESPAFGRVDLDRTVIESGVAQVAPVPAVEVPAYSEVRFAPGGIHLMLMKPAQTLRAGEHVPLYLILDSGARLAVQLRVVEPGSAGDEHAHKTHD